MYVPEGVTAKDLATRNFEHWRPPSEKNLREAFAKFDLDGNGVIDFGEIKTCMFRYFGIKLTKEESKGMLVLYDTDGSGDLCYEEFKCMVQNLESIDPESISRFWLKTLGWFPPYRFGLWVAKKFGTGKRRRRLMQEIDETQKLLDKSKKVLGGGEKAAGGGGKSVAAAGSAAVGGRHTLDNVDIVEMSMRHRNKASSGMVGVRKHRGKAPTGRARRRKKSKSFNNSFRPSLQPTGAFKSRIDNFMGSQKQYYDSESAPVERRGKREGGGSTDTPDNSKSARTRASSSFNSRPKHWPPQGRRNRAPGNEGVAPKSRRSRLKQEFSAAMADATLMQKMVRNRGHKGKKKVAKALVGGNGGTVGFMPQDFRSTAPRGQAAGGILKVPRAVKPSKYAVPALPVGALKRVVSARTGKGGAHGAGNDENTGGNGNGDQPRSKRRVSFSSA
jgi:hypothetical protein